MMSCEPGGARTGSSDLVEKTVGGQPSVSMARINIVARIAVELAFASMVGRGKSARTVEVQAFVSTASRNTDAETVEDHTFASTVNGKANARIVVEHQFASMVNRKTAFQTAMVLQFANQDRNHTIQDVELQATEGFQDSVATA